MILPAMAWKLGRYLAPMALVGVIIATFLVVQAGLGNSHHSTTGRRDRSIASSHAAPRHRFYVIRAGDSLSMISVRTGVSLPTLEALNPSVDPNALQTGQRLRLRR